METTNTNETNGKSAVYASVSVPVNEQDAFRANRDNLMNLLESKNRKMSFSNLVRLLVNTAVLESRDNVDYLVMKL